MFSSGSSKHRGVCWDKAAGKWVATIRLTGSGNVRIYCGPSEEAAWSQSLVPSKGLFKCGVGVNNPGYCE